MNWSHCFVILGGLLLLLGFATLGLTSSVVDFDNEDYMYSVQPTEDVPDDANAPLEYRSLSDDERRVFDRSLERNGESLRFDEKIDGSNFVYSHDTDRKLHVEREDQIYAVRSKVIYKIELMVGGQVLYQEEGLVYGLPGTLVALAQDLQAHLDRPDDRLQYWQLLLAVGVPLEGLAVRRWLTSRN